MLARYTGFQSTLPREERQFKLCKVCILIGDFNPRSHERSDNPLIYKALRAIISIHAPTRGATPTAAHWYYSFVFQSTLPREERPLASSFTPLMIAEISIHAPTRGATFCGVPQISGHKISIHAPTRGATPGLQILPPLLLFQSTLPREERP